jgi:arylsulfatase A-like enzyme
MNRRKFLGSAAGAGMIAASTFTANSKAASDKSTRPNILWIMMDDARADTLGSYGQPWVKTPAMDKIAANGVRFKTAIVQNPVCVPSRSSMLTGHYAHTIKMMAMGKSASDPPRYHKDSDGDRQNLLEFWTNNGITPVNVGKRHGYDKYFADLGDTYPHFDVLGKPRTDFAKSIMADKDPDGTYPEAITKTHKWAIGGRVPLKPEESSTWDIGTNAVNSLTGLAEKNEPFFLRVSFHAPHVACRVPESHFTDPKTIDLPLPTDKELRSKPEFERNGLKIYAGADLTDEQIGIARGTYYGMVSLVDVQVARIMEVLERSGLADNTIIAINSDQGFQLGEHGLWKKRVFYDDNVCVPLVLSCPKLLPSGKVVREPVELIDFMPTLMDLSGFTVPETISGKSLMPLIRGEVSEWREACFCEMDHSQSMYEELRTGTGRRVMVRTKKWKLVYFMDERDVDKDGCLYDLENDPGETVNLYSLPEQRETIRYLEDLSETWAQTS